MYSGTTLTKFSGRIMGAHQRIDRVARNHLWRILENDSAFPPIKNILYFEGKNGPDALKRKSPAQDEPWHYYSPFNEADSRLLISIKDHYDLLVKQLKKGNQERAAFEAAWLAHALVDGLTPAHHYPYEAKLVELRGEGIETRVTLKEKWLIHGKTPSERIRKNWKVWGPKGLITAHGMFEIGIATLLTPLRFGEAVPTQNQLQTIRKIGIIDWFKRAAKEVAVMEMYDEFAKKGWTPKLAYKIRHKLAPTIVQTVTLAWYAAYADAGLVDKKSK